MLRGRQTYSSTTWLWIHPCVGLTRKLWQALQALSVFVLAQSQSQLSTLQYKGPLTHLRVHIRRLGTFLGSSIHR